MELRRTDIGFGRLVVDDAGVTRRGLFRTRSLRWDEIGHYRLTIRLHGFTPDAPEIPRALYVLDDLVSDLLYARDVFSGVRGRSQIGFGIELHGDAGRRVAFDYVRFHDSHLAIAAILERIGDRLATAARVELAAHGTVRFGPLALAPHAVQWGKHAPLTRDTVESIELFDTSPVHLRVMARRKILPYGHASTDRIPNVVAALALAKELGYPVKGLKLFDALRR